MDDTSQALTTTNRRLGVRITGGGEEEDDDGGKFREECRDVEVWETLSKSFKEVQRVLDHNRHLIQQANGIHQSMVPRNLARNVELIHEINGNISRVIGLYSNLSSNFTNTVQQRRRSKDANVDAVSSKN